MASLGNRFSNSHKQLSQDPASAMALLGNLSQRMEGLRSHSNRPPIPPPHTHTFIAVLFRIAPNRETTQVSYKA